MTRYTIMKGKLVPIKLAENGARFISPEMMANFSEDRIREIEKDRK